MPNNFITILRDFVLGAQAGGGVAAELTAEVFNHAARQNLLPVLAYENKRRGLFEDKAVSKRLEGILYGTVAAGLNRCLDFETLSKCFTQRGIEHMPVKGYYLKKLYPVEELRTFGDIDLLIHKEDRQKTHELMLELGYTVKQDWEPTYSYVKGAEYYEIHTNLMDGNLDERTDMQAYFESAWQYAEADEGLRFRPSLDFHFIYTLCHIAKHLYGGGAGVRMYLDVALFIKKHDAVLDWSAIQKEFATLKLEAFFYTVMNACRRWFCVETVCPLPEADEAALDALLEYTLDSDLFGHTRDHSVIELRNAGEGESSHHKVIWRMIFPRARDIEARYTFLQGRPYLLPIAWVARVFTNLGALPSRLKSIRSISTTDTMEVNTYDAFMKRIGL